MESLDGKISRVVFHKPSRFSPSGEKFLIAKLTDGTTIKGNMSRPVVGELYRFWGEHRNQKNGYDDAFEFASFEAICDQSSAGVAKYLSAHVEGIGQVKAAAIVEHFGAETLTVLRSNPARALEIDGISETIIAAIRAHFDDATALDPVAYSRLVEMFAPYRISQRIVKLLVKSFGSSAPDKIIENPYLLLAYPRIGWKTIDSFAMTTAGYPPEGIERHKAAVLESMEQASNNGGHTCATESEMLNGAEKLLGCRLDHRVIATLIGDGSIVETLDQYGTIYQLAALAEAERTIAEKLAVLMAAGSPLPSVLVTDEWLTETGLGADQIAAAKMVENCPVAIIAGPPGTGKTYTLSRVLGRLREIGVTSIRVMAPTGKAAKRAGELLGQVEACRGIPSTTIHKALAPSPGMAPEGVPQSDAKFGRGREEFTFGKDEAHPFDERVIVVDETSMVDVKLMAHLLRAVKPGTQVIFVGDWNQLPSVGPGSVLRDLRNLVPTVELTQIRRSDGGGTVVRACHAIKDGIVPNDAPALDLPTDNWIHLEMSDGHAIARKIVELHANARNFDPFWGMQVVSAQKAKLAFGCDHINRLLSETLNPDPYAAQRSDDDGEGGPAFRIGDKVIRTKNGLADEMIPWDEREDDEDGKSRPDLVWCGQKWVTREIPLVNGDMGMVQDILADDDKPSVIVRFRDPDRLVRLALGDSHLMLAYAITVHKGQGSGFPLVVMPVHRSFYPGLFVRELIYTGMSRMEQVLVTVGEWSAIEAAINRKTVHLRKTTLRRRLEAAIAETEAMLESIGPAFKQHTAIEANSRFALPPAEEGETDALEIGTAAMTCPALPAPEPAPWEVLDFDSETVSNNLAFAETQAK